MPQTQQYEGFWGRRARAAINEQQRGIFLMQKKLLALAVAGALAAPAVAMAQSAVTISGIFKVGIDNYKIDSPSTVAPTGGTAHAGTNTSENRVTDNSS